MNSQTINAIYAANNAQPIHLLPPNMTIPNSTTLLPHIHPTSNNVTLPLRLATSPVRNKTPAQSVTRKMLEPAVLATTMPDWPHLAEMIETSFSGSVVAKERSVMPRTVLERENSVERVVTLCERM